MKTFWRKCIDHVPYVTGWAGWLMIQHGLNLNLWVSIGGSCLLFPFFIQYLLFMDEYLDPKTREMHVHLPEGFTLEPPMEQPKQEVKH